jgi:N-acetylneuraminic acid mutarotase
MRPLHVVHRRVAPAAFAALAILGACSKDSSDATGPGSHPGTPSYVTSTVTASPDSIAADGGSSTTISVRLVDGSNVPLTTSGGAVSIKATLGSVGAVTDHGDGTYTATMTSPTQTGEGFVSAFLGNRRLADTVIVWFVPGPPSAQISMLFAQDQVVLADGASSTVVRLVLRDAYGNVITSPSGALAFTTTRGTISAPSAVPGGFTATLTSSNTEGVAVVRATIGAQPLGDSTSVRFALHQLWARKASLVSVAYYGASASVGGILYSISGVQYDDDGSAYYQTAVDAYDPASDHWTSRAPIPTPRSDFGAVSVNGVVYVIGGFTGGGKTGSVEAYDPATNTWTEKAPMPTARADLGVAVVGGIIYAVGGSDDTLGTIAVESYDPATNHWTVHASMPEGRVAFGAGVVGGTLYAVGGVPNPTSTVLAYDPVADAWSWRPFMPTGRVTPSAGALGAKLYALGGDENAEFELYDPGTNTWASATPMPVQGYGGSSTIVNGSLYAVRVGDGSSVFMYVP